MITRICVTHPYNRFHLPYLITGTPVLRRIEAPERCLSMESPM